MLRFVVLLVLLCFSATSIADTLREARPAKMGMSAERLERVTAVAQRYVDEGKLPGVITIINRGGRIVHFESIGKRGVEDTRTLDRNDLFRIYSMTKPITAVAAMQLYEQGKFYLNDPIKKFIPELSDLKVMTDEGELVATDQDITMHHILTHTAGFSYGFDPRDPVDKLYEEAELWSSENLTHFAEKLAALPLKFQPGSHYHYSVAVDVTGLVVERISGVRFDRYLHENIFEPLGMEDTFFEVPESKRDRFLPIQYWDHKEGKLKAIKEGESGLLDSSDAMSDYHDVRLYSGGGGLVSSTMDYMRFAEMLRNGGAYNGARILSPTTIRYMTENHLPRDIAASGTGEQPGMDEYRGFGFGLGFGVLTDPVAARVVGSKGTYSWGGAAGTIFWVDPVEDLVVIGMVQHFMSPVRFREDIRIAAYQAILDSYK